MPLLNGRVVEFVSPPTDLTSSTKVFQLRFTGEIFREYEDYSARLDFYRQTKFACKYTGKSGFTFEQALDHEIQTKACISDQIPSQYLPIIFETVQFSQLKLSVLVNTIHQKIIDEANKAQPSNTHQTQLSNDTNHTLVIKPKSPPKKTQRAPVTKIKIRTQIRVAAKQQNFKNAPWILHDEIAEKYNVSKQLPPHLQALITQYIQNLNKKRKTPRSKSKETKMKKEKPVKVDTLISALSIKCNRSLKYPCDDQLLLMYDKLNNDQIIKYDAFWKHIDKIGLYSAGDMNSNDDNDNYSNLAFIDYNMIYDTEEASQSTQSNLQIMKHRQLNDMFHEIWKLWSFVTMFHAEIGMTQFPLSYLMDALCYDKRSVLIDELMVCFLDMIRKHFIWYLDQEKEDKKQTKIKQHQSRKKARKKRERSAKQKQKSEKEEMDVSDKEESDESEEESEAESEYTVSETDESSEDEEMDFTDHEDEDEIMDILAELRFSREPLNGFRLEILRNYLQFRCNTSQEEDNEIVRAILPANTSANISDEIWDRLSNIRQYMTLGIEAQLEIIKILFDDAQHCEISRQIMNDRLERYYDIKQEIKVMDDEYGAMVKEEKAKLRKIRTELFSKKKELKHKRAANATSASSASSSSSSSSSSGSSSVSPNKENNSTKSNSRSSSTNSTTDAPRGTSRQKELLRKKKELLRKKEEKEKQQMLAMEDKQREDLKHNIFKLDDLFKNTRDSMNAKCKDREMAIMYHKYELLAQCATGLMELGSDRFNNKYYWNLWSDARIFVLHSNSIYHHHNDGASVTQTMMKLNECNDMKCYNEWEVKQMMNGDHKNQFCWSYISTVTQFHNLLDVLDERGIRESKLLRMLKTLKNDIIRYMKMIGNDDYQEEEQEVIEVEDEPKQLRRSKRATKQIPNDVNVVYSNKSFLTYRNKIKRK